MTTAKPMPPGRATLMAALEELKEELRRDPCPPPQQGPLDPLFLRSKFGYGLLLPDGRYLINGVEVGPTKEWLALLASGR